MPMLSMKTKKPMKPMLEILAITRRCRAELSETFTEGFATADLLEARDVLESRW
jgi:hypothetical protein